MNHDLNMNVELRLATKDDAAAVAEIYRPFVASTPISFEIEPPDPQEMQRRIDSTLPRHAWLICEHRGEVVGYAYAGPHRDRAAYQWSVDTSVYVHSAFHRRGIGRGLYTSLFRILVAQGFVSAYAGITLPNTSSVALHESAGFELVGVYRNAGFKLGQWYSVGWWQRALRAPEATPSPPLNLDDIQRDPSWQQMLISGLSCVREVV
jgi:L-amino acid N-acyltransferase YncA